MAQVWVGIDTGGTFTDFVFVDAGSGRRYLHKAPTTPDDPARGILSGLADGLRAAGDAAQVAAICHGTTLATNAVLQGNWARTGMITTRGFRDVLDLARQRRPSFFNLDIEKPTPPALRDQRIEVGERMAPDGAVVEPLDETGVRAAAAALRAAGCRAVAVCLLHAYANPDHERRAAALVRQEWPDAYVCASSEILPEFREFERFATATVNASLMPVLDRYLEAFEHGLAGLGVTAALTVMQSNGGTAATATIRRAPVNTFFSGPAGGVIGAVALAREAGAADFVTFDMGGTSTDVCLIRAGEPERANVREMGGFPVRARTLDMHTIGAGGGSLAWVDPGGRRSAARATAAGMPGPPCYGRGGERPTVTDANMLLGRLNPRALLDGRMAVYPDKALAAIETHLAGRLAMDPVEAAVGVLDIVNVNMLGAVRVISVERGEDPRRFALMPFGGAGPLHAAAVAALAGMREVLVPAAPGVLSAAGLLLADARGEFGVTLLTPAEPDGLPALDAAIGGLRDRSRAWLASEALDPAGAMQEYLAEMRYLGQNHDLPVPLDAPGLDAAGLDRLVDRFHAAHRRAYGHDMPDRRVEIVTLRLSTTVRRPSPPGWRDRREPSRLGEAVAARRPVWFAGPGFVDTPVYARAQIPLDARFAGPAVIEQMDATTIVPPGAEAASDPAGNLLIRLAAAGPEGQRP